MTGRRSRRVLTSRSASVAVVALALGGCAGVAMITDQQDRARGRGVHAGAKVVTTETGSVVARQVDRKRGLVFIVNSAGDSGLGNELSVRLAHGAPPRTRKALLTRPLVASCAVPGQHVTVFPGHWNELFAQYSTALVTEDLQVVVARVTTDCALWVGQPRDEDSAVLPPEPFSRVPMR